MKNKPIPTSSEVHKKFIKRIDNARMASNLDADPWICLSKMKRIVDAALNDFPFMVECPVCGHEAFWLSNKTRPSGRHVCFSLDCYWTSSPEQIQVGENDGEKDGEKDGENGGKKVGESLDRIATEVERLGLYETNP